MGSVDGLDEKLTRLFIFYQQVLSKTGFDKYAVLDVQYNGQVVAMQKGSKPALDSTELKKNLAELVERNKIDEAMLQQELQKQETILEMKAATPEVPVVKNTNPITTKAKIKNTAKPVRKIEIKKSEGKKTDVKKVVAAKSEIKKVPAVKTDVKKPAEKKPKAVMGPPNDY
jgi:cell division protein FtsQ